MEVVSDTNTYLSIKHKDGSIPNGFIFTYAKAGYGKTLAMESILEEYHRAGYVILCLADVKDQFELGYAMFPPQKPYHLNELKKVNKPIETHPVKLYHPISNAIPKTKLPDMTLYGFSLKKLGDEEWSMLCESEGEGDTVRILKNASYTMNDTDGLYAFLHLIEESIFGQKEGNNYIRDPKVFNLKTSIGTAKSLQDVASYFLKFQDHPFLVSEDSPFKLNWKEILNDNKHYHVFGTRWIEDPKLKQFCILGLLSQFVRERKNTKKPVLLVIPEIRFLTPSRARGYVTFLAGGISKNLSIIRNKGKGGNSFVGDAQVWSDVDEPVRNSATSSMYGSLGGEKDIELLAKAKRLKADTIKQLQVPDVPRTYLWSGDMDIGGFKLWLPGHAHSEEEYDFFEMYKEYYPEKMKSYGDILRQISEKNEEEKERVDGRIKKKEQRQKEEKEKRNLEKQAMKENKVQDLKEQIKVEKQKKTNFEKDEKKRRVIELYEMNKPIRKIREEVKMHHYDVKEIIREYEEQKNKPKEIDRESISQNIGSGVLPEEIDSNYGVETQEEEFEEKTLEETENEMRKKFSRNTKEDLEEETDIEPDEEGVIYDSYEHKKLANPNDTEFDYLNENDLENSDDE